tara:strand:+ start:4773 stop:5447 length:675 start_codon:yes stop_codon:yes gene_type:complete
MHQLISKKIVIYLFLFFLLATIDNSSIINFSLPKIDKIEISGISVSESREVNKKIENLKLKNIFFISELEIKENLFSINTVEQLSIFKNYPSTLQIDIKKTKYLALTKKNGIDYLIGTNGKLIKKNKSTLKLPFIFGDLDIQEFLKLKRNIDKSIFDFDQISNLYFYKSKRWDIETSKGYLIKLPKKNINEILSLFVRLSKEEKLKDNRIIDFRQKDQIIFNAK